MHTPVDASHRRYLQQAYDTADTSSEMIECACDMIRRREREELDFNTLDWAICEGSLVRDENDGAGEKLIDGETNRRPRPPLSNIIDGGGVERSFRRSLNG